MDSREDRYAATSPHYYETIVIGMAREDTAQPAIMQRQNERCRLLVDGKRTDDGARCELLAVHEISGAWCLYPHGWGKFGVRLPRDEAETLARAILDEPRG